MVIAIERERENFYLMHMQILIANLIHLCEVIAPPSYCFAQDIAEESFQVPVLLAISHHRLTAISSYFQELN